MKAHARGGEQREDGRERAVAERDGGEGGQTK